MNAQKALMTIEEVIETTGIGRTTVFKLLKSGELKAVKIGTRTFVRPQHLSEFIDNAEARGVAASA